MISIIFTEVEINVNVLIVVSGHKTQLPLPRQSIADFGFKYCTSGWYDVQNQGVCNDFCRWVGSEGCKNPALSYWSCALAGSTYAYTKKGEFHEGDKNMRTCFSSGII